MVSYIRSVWNYFNVLGDVYYWNILYACTEEIEFDLFVIRTYSLAPVLQDINHCDRTQHHTSKQIRVWAIVGFARKSQ